MRTSRSGTVAVIAGALTFGAACDGDRRDAATVTSAIRRFRTADNPSIPSAVDALRATPCSAPEACHARDTCLAAGEKTAKALRINAEVEQGLAALDKGTLKPETPEAQSLPKKLEESKVLLKEGLDGLPACDERVLSLKKKHRL